MFQDFSPVIFQSPVCVLQTALVFARVLPVNDVLSTRAFFSSTHSPSLFALNLKSAFTLSFSCKSSPEWIFGYLLNQARLSLLVHRQ